MVEFRVLLCDVTREGISDEVGEETTSFLRPILRIPAWSCVPIEIRDLSLLALVLGMEISFVCIPAYAGKAGWLKLVKS